MATYRTLGDQDSNLDSRIQSPLSCQLDDPRLRGETVSGLAVVTITPLGFRPEMGSLIKKRRKRMRKKKHRKMLKATRFQRRAAGK